MTVTFGNVSDALMELDADGSNPNFDALMSTAAYLAQHPDDGIDVPGLIGRVKAWQLAEDDFVPEWHDLFS